MLYLLLAILSSAMISICMRISEKYVKNEMGMFMANYMLCILLSWAFMEDKGNLLKSAISGNTILLGAICGTMYLVNFAILKHNMKHNGVVMSSTFMKLGVLLPTLMAIVIFHEVPKAAQVIGILLSLVAIVIIHFEKDALTESNKKIWLMILLLLSGLTDSMANIFEQTGNAKEQDAYLMITFFTAFVIALLLALLGKEGISLKDVAFGVLIGIPNYFSARFLLLSLGSVEAVLVYPLYSVGTIIAVTLAGIIMFHEKISKKKLCALALIIVACFMLNG